MMCYTKLWQRCSSATPLIDIPARRVRPGCVGSLAVPAKFPQSVNSHHQRVELRPRRCRRVLICTRTTGLRGMEGMEEGVGIKEGGLEAHLAGL